MRNREIPVLLVIFNRPKTTIKVLDAIRSIAPKRLYIASDGPRPTKDGEEDIVLELRKISTKISWDCDVKTLFRKENLGCGRSVKEAIDWFFHHEECGIILEDDTVPTVDFYEFCTVLLDRYKKDHRVGMIAGTNHLSYNMGDYSYCFSKNKACWGWATWRRSWENMDLDMSWRQTPYTNAIIKNMGLTRYSMRHWKNALRLIDDRLVDAWDWQWYFSLSAQNQLCIFPRVNLVANIGFGPDATHTFGSPKNEYLIRGDLDFPLIHPDFLVPDIKYDEVFEFEKMKEKFRIGKFIPIRIKGLLKKILRLG